VTIAILGCVVAGLLAYLFGHHRGYLEGYESAKSRPWDKCVHNVCGVVGYPKGDRYVCLDCGEALDR
jgi:type IV secretory pathway VirB2 component (pilin)